MLVDIVSRLQKRYEKNTKKQQHDSFYWWYARLLKLNDSFKISIDINIQQKDNNLLLQKRIKEKLRNRSSAIINYLKANFKDHNNKYCNSFH